MPLNHSQLALKIICNDPSIEMKTKQAHGLENYIAEEAFYYNLSSDFFINFL